VARATPLVGLSARLLACAQAPRTRLRGALPIGGVGMVSKVIGSGMVVALALTGALSTAIPAQAAPAPTCVYHHTWSTWRYDYAEAWNYCSSPKRFKFIWAFAPDGGCYYYAVDAGRREWRTKQARFDGLQSC
jgi:hypothetical protein